MNIAENTVVSMKYALTVEDELIDQGEMDYLHGHHNIVVGLEKAMTGKTTGDAFTVAVTPTDGYGVYDPEGVQEVGVKDFPEEAEIVEGAMFYAEDANGNPSPFTVMAVEEDRVMIDFNHELAGETLNFDITVMGVRAATEEEIAHGHVHGPHGHAHE